MQGLGGSLEVRVLLSSFKGSFLRVRLRMSKSFNACCRGGFRVQGLGFRVLREISSRVALTVP